MKVGEYGGNSHARSVGSIVGECLQEMGLSKGLNEHKVFDAWDNVSGASRHTLSCSFRDGTLIVRLSSSVIRSELYSRLNSIRHGMNRDLAADPLFTRPADDPHPVKKIVLQ